MEYSTVLWSLDLPWLTFLAYWIIKAPKTRQTQKQESFVPRYFVMLLLVTCYVLIFSRSARIGFLATRFVPDAKEVVVAGVVVTWIGVGLAICSRYHLAENWSSRVSIKQGHELIRTGPYARLRHPIYTGLLLATLGSAIAIGEWRGLLGLGFAVVAYSIKARKEEAMLTEQFGDAFTEHKRNTGFLVPKL
jgi:protein-S-isoprenylcysteine O-methyltransferase Ste14